MVLPAIGVKNNPLGRRPGVWSDFPGGGGAGVVRTRRDSAPVRVDAEQFSLSGNFRQTCAKPQVAAAASLGDSTEPARLGETSGLAAEAMAGHHPRPGYQ